jgi:hypothetical protein
MRGRVGHLARTARRPPPCDRLFPQQLPRENHAPSPRRCCPPQQNSPPARRAAAPTQHRHLHRVVRRLTRRVTTACGPRRGVPEPRPHHTDAGPGRHMRPLRRPGEAQRAGTWNDYDDSLRAAVDPRTSRARPLACPTGYTACAATSTPPRAYYEDRSRKAPHQAYRCHARR